MTWSSKDAACAGLSWTAGAPADGPGEAGRLWVACADPGTAGADPDGDGAPEATGFGAPDPAVLAEDGAGIVACRATGVDPDVA